MTSLIVGTAGHIDHGKSALVRALTGTDPDRLPEEKKRGITIDLGFADLELGDLRLGFVDVPGHERFIKNMLAGAHGIDLVALVIAADEGVMPQTQEHFDICRLLGVRAGIVVITKKDLVEEEMLSLVEEEAAKLVVGSFLEGAPIVSVSSITGSGLDELRIKLQEVARSVPPRSSDFVMRLPVDRAFSMRGFGAVITGTLISGEVSEGDEMELLPAKVNVRVRGTQVHGKRVTTAYAGQRTAVNLAGIDVDQLERGMVLAPVGTLRPTQIIDLWINVLSNASRGLRSRTRVRFHIGAAEVLGRVRILDEPSEISPGKDALAQIRLESPVVALHGDHFIIRSYSPAETIAGGVIVDPFAGKHRGKEIEKTRQRLHSLMNADRATKFAGFARASGEHGVRLSDIAAATGWRKEVLAKAAAEAKTANEVVDAGSVFLATEDFARLCQNVLDELEGHHKREPLARGILRETLREKLFARSLAEVFGAVVARLETDGSIVSDKDIIRLQSHKIDLSEKDKQLMESLEQVYLSAGVEVPSLDDIMSLAGVAEPKRVQARKVLQLLIDKQKIVRVQGDMFMHARVIEELKAKLLTYGSQHEPDRLIDVAAFKDLAGVSRKYAIPLLEYFDRERITRRAGDKRMILRPR
jgi:selenocysteine-specific elongation factor